MSGLTVPARRSSSAARRAPSGDKKPPGHAENGAGGGGGTASVANHSKPGSPNGVERTVKKLRLSKALTIPEGTTVYDACRRMATRRVDSVLLTDADGLLSGIVTDKDISTRVIAEGLRPEQTIVSKIMTRSPQFVMADTLAIEALQKMVQGKFRHLPVVESGEVIAMLDITKCLYDAISRLEKAAEQGSAIAAAVEGVERHWGSDFSGPYAFIETLRERMFKPSLSTVITESTKVAVLSLSDSVDVATKKMREFRVNSVIVVNGSKPQGILTSKDVLMRVVAQNLPPELTLVEKVMTVNPECATPETTLLDALHIMHDGKFLHLPVVDGDECVIACLDVLQLTHAAISMVNGGTDAVNEMTNTMMQTFWNSAFALEPADDEIDTNSDVSTFMQLEHAESGKHMYPPFLGNSFAFKFKDQKGHVHRFDCGTDTLAELVSAVLHRIRFDGDQDKVQILYEDDEGDWVLLATDNDLVTAVNNAKVEGRKVLRLHIDYSEMKKETEGLMSEPSKVLQKSGLEAGILAGTIVIAGVGLFYLRRSNV